MFSRKMADCHYGPKTWSQRVRNISQMGMKVKVPEIPKRGFLRTNMLYR